jgi:AraC family ethanolamine operon transcriptional activator
MEDGLTQVPGTPIGSRRHVFDVAEAFIKANISSPIELKHLCRLTRVSERTVRNAFHEGCGMSPKQFLLRARLNHVRETLRELGSQVTVTTVATDCGFSELGRFAGRYKATFGEYPSDTLRR